jgi:hypothetical protein
VEFDFAQKRRRKPNLVDEDFVTLCGPTCIFSADRTPFSLQHDRGLVEVYLAMDGAYSAKGPPPHRLL